jgi:hypothetical protein
MAKDTDEAINKMRTAFAETYGDPDDHPLYEQFLRELGTRGLNAIMTDIGEAAAYRRQQPPVPTQTKSAGGRRLVVHTWLATLLRQCNRWMGSKREKKTETLQT